MAPSQCPLLVNIKKILDFVHFEILFKLELTRNVRKMKLNENSIPS